VLSLADDELHVWYWHFDAAGPDHGMVTPDKAAWLSSSERVRYERLQLARRRRAFLAGKLFLREVLSHYSDRPPQSWEFVENDYGKPALKDGQENLAFNLSHSRQAYMLALSRHARTGADIEFSARRRRVGRLAGRYFSAPECDWLLALSEAGQQEGFYCLWTLKEAYIKARGLGLALPLDSFSFDLASAPAIAFAEHEAALASSRQWQFWRLAVPWQSEGHPPGQSAEAADYHAAVAVAAEGRALSISKQFLFNPRGEPELCEKRILAQSPGLLAGLAVDQ
jgi:4'-phosphopantetheinyl transferase